MRNRRYYTDDYGNDWMAYDTEPSYCMPSRRARILLPNDYEADCDCDIEAGTVGCEGE